jgi:cell division septum initiation protein DivIVA
MNVELQETRGLARALFAMIEQYREVKPVRDTQAQPIARAANRMEEAILGGLRTACDELADDFLDQEEIKREIARLEATIEQKRAAIRPHHVGAGTT